MELSKLNKYQTPITEELKQSLPKEVYDNLLEYISTVKFIQNLIAPEEVRGFAKDRPKDENYNDNRIIVDITNPHILEDMEFFRERAIFFDKNGRYTNIPPNSNPKSEYAEFWKQELHKWKHGVVRPSDGEWIPGQLYFYWNYSPIWLVETVNNNKTGKKKGERKRKFAKPWLGDYLFYHYMEQGRTVGKHGKLLKTRGVGFSFKMDSCMALMEALRMLISSMICGSKWVTAKVRAWASIIGFRNKRFFSDSCLESFRISFLKSVGSITAAAVTGPARQPRPASSVPVSSLKVEWFESSIFFIKI